MVWTTTSIVNATLGGLLIGFGVSILLLFNGKVAGVSGIFAQTLKLKFHQQGWRYTFLLGLLVSPIFYGFVSPLPTITISASNLTIIVAGLLVGVGTRMSNGCTSGHGVCGIARLSVRSIIATLIFMFFGILTVLIIRHLL